jgi:hypothetical protein
LQLLLVLIKPIIIKPDQISGSREIAQGSFGTIFSAIYNKRRVAVKRINKVCGALLWCCGRQGHARSCALKSLILIPTVLRPACKRYAEGSDLLFCQDRSKSLADKMREAYLVRYARGFRAFALPVGAPVLLR